MIRGRIAVAQQWKVPAFSDRGGSAAAVQWQAFSVISALCRQPALKCGNAPSRIRGGRAPVARSGLRLTSWPSTRPAALRTRAPPVLIWALMRPARSR